MGLIDDIRMRGVPAGATDGPPVARGGRRPTLAQTAERVRAGEPGLDAVRDFLDSAQDRPVDELIGLICEPPAPTGDARIDALLAGVAEHLCIRSGVPPPAWTGQAGRFLDRLWFVSEVSGLRAVALAQSPVALKRRGILWPERSMRRV